MFFELYDEDTAGLRRTGLAEPPGPQERVPRHTVEQVADVAPMVQILDAPVSQLVDKLEDVLKIVDLFVPVQEIGVPKISSLSRPPLRRVLPVPQTAEQLVDVPVLDVILAYGRCDLGLKWCQIATGVGAARRDSQAGRYINTGRAEAVAVVDVPVVTQHKFQQSFVDFFKVP